MSIESVMPSSCLSLCQPPLLLPSNFPSIRVFSNELALHIKWPKYWTSALAPVLPMNNQSWFPLGLTGLSPCSSKDSQESLPAPQFKSINSSVLSLLYGPALTSIYGKTKALTIPTFVSKVTSLLFNMLSRFAIAFLPRSKCLLISWQQSASAVVSKPKKNCFHSPLHLPWSDGTGWQDLSFLNVVF